MGQIVKQPNGLYAIWSSYVDNFIMVDATPEEIIQDYLEQSEKQIRKNVTETIAALERGEKPSYQFTKSFDECVAWIRRYHSPDDESLQMLGIATPIPESCKQGNHQWQIDEDTGCGKNCEMWYCPLCGEDEEREKT